MWEMQVHVTNQGWGGPMTAKEDKSGQERVEEMIPENN
jgi:hypothetical protein